jgi:hypothetical protein
MLVLSVKLRDFYEVHVCHGQRSDVGLKGCIVFGHGARAVHVLSIETAVACLHSTAWASVLRSA